MFGLIVFAAVVVALCADEAQAITGQVFHVWGGSVNALHGWSAGELFDAPEGWNSDALLSELVARFPERFAAVIAANTGQRDDRSGTAHGLRNDVRVHPVD